MVAAIVLFSFGMVFYAYFGYPLLLLFLNKIRPQQDNAQIPTAAEKEPVPLTIIITVRNEEKVIREKLEATLALNYGSSTTAAVLASAREKLQLIVASDASEDETDNIVREYQLKGVELVRLEQRGGKEKAQSAAVQQAHGSIIVFTDAKIKLNPEALNNFVRYFRDPTVGAVSSVDRVEAGDGTASGEGFYVRYEMWLRGLESNFLSLVGLSGSCFAVRKAVAVNLATDIPSDFALLLEARRQGLRGVSAPDVIGTYKAVKTEEEEFSRKVRTVLRGISALFARREVLSIRKYGVFAWQVISHKLCRWLVPWLFFLGSLATFCIASSSWFFALLSLLLLVFFGSAAFGYLSPAHREKVFCKVPLFFIVSNTAVAVAGLKYLAGRRAVVWNPSAKG